MSDLENRYRRALRWYPKEWRVRNEDAVLGTLLDLADDELRTEPSRGELANLRNSGLSTRLGFVGRRVPKAVREHAAILTFGLGTAISAAGILFGGWTWDYADGSYHQVWSAFALLHNLGSGQAIYVIWVAGLVTALFRLRRTTTVLLLTSIPVSFVWPLLAVSLSNYGHPDHTTLGFLDLLAAVSVTGSVATQTRGRRRLAMSIGVFAALLALAFWARQYGYWGYGANAIDYFWAPLAVWLVLLGIPLALVIAAVFWRAGRQALGGGILLAAVPLLPLGLFAFSRSDVPATAGTIFVVMVGAALLVGILRVFGLRIRITRS
jgi:hypothetical protein